MTVQRQLLIQPYMPDYTENLGTTAGQFNDQDIGKAVKYSGDTMVLCATSNDIVGFITSVEPGTKDGHSIGAVRKSGRMEVLDEAGTLAVGDFVEAGTAGTLGTLAKQKVVTSTPNSYAWVVIAIDMNGTSGTNSDTLIERV